MSFIYIIYGASDSLSENGDLNMKFDRIAINSNICHGQACIKGTRMPVHQVVQMLANGDVIDDLLHSYPTIEREDILSCLEYAAYLTQEQVTPIENISV
jgi:uncharacterized protein (DUF433 family)